MRRRRLLAAAVLLTATACAHRGGTFAPDGFHHSRYEYGVRYADPAELRVMSEDWRLDNYERTEDGLEPKESDFYRTFLEFDTNRDGGYDAAENVPTFELRFKHVKTDAVVWLRTIPAPEYETSKSVYGLARYADGIAVAGYELAQFGEKIEPDARKFAVQILQTRPAVLARRPALSLTMEVASLAELKRSALAKRERVKLVIVRTGNTSRIPATDYEYETVLVAGYASRPETFTENLADFERLLSQVILHARSGYKELPLG